LADLDFSFLKKIQKAQKTFFFSFARWMSVAEVDVYVFPDLGG
jgi:hypothetical protein